LGECFRKRFPFISIQGDTSWHLVIKRPGVRAVVNRVAKVAKAKAKAKANSRSQASSNRLIIGKADSSSRARAAKIRAAGKKQSHPTTTL
jgi:hypothetical protein